MMHKQCKH